MRAFRIADRRHPIFDPTGAFLNGGRWNSPGRRVIYAAETYAGAMLEVLVHANIRGVPKTQAVVEIHIPDDMGVEELPASILPGWNSDDLTASRSFGDRWLDEGRTAVLLVPSVVLQDRERNVLLNPNHAAFAQIAVSDQVPVIWDTRLFAPRL